MTCNICLRIAYFIDESYHVDIASMKSFVVQIVVLHGELYHLESSLFMNNYIICRIILYANEAA